jgi:hypothetical protein
MDHQDERIQSKSGKPETDGDANPYAPPLASGAARPNVADGAALSPPVTSAVFRLGPKDASAATGAMTSRLYLVILLTVAFSAVASAILFAGLAYHRFGFSQRTLEASKPLGMIAAATVAAFIWLRFRRSSESPHEVTVELSPEGLLVSVGNLSQSKLSWASIGEIRSTQDHILFINMVLHPNSGRWVKAGVTPVPRRAFATPEAGESFLRTARMWQAAARAITDLGVR